MAELGDRLAVTDLLYRYAELIDAGDFDGVGQLLGRSTFAGTRSPKTSGANAISKLFAATTRRYAASDVAAGAARASDVAAGAAPETGTPRTRHLVLNAIVEVDADRTTATARSTFCVIQAADTVALQPIVVGRYYDTFGRDEDGWFFTAREVDVEMVGDVSGHLNFDPKAFDK